MIEIKSKIYYLKGRNRIGDEVERMVRLPPDYDDCETCHALKLIGFSIDSIDYRGTSERTPFIPVE
jgi:hypothetical protein